MNRNLMHTRSAPTAPPDALHRVVDAGQLSLRAAAQGDAGTFEGYAVLWDVKDSYGTTFAPMCFGAGGLDTDLYALLDMHWPDRVLGTFTAREDDQGMFISGGWDDTAAGRDARARAKSGSSAGLSVGFTALAVDPDDDERFTQCRLIEVSQITARMAAVPGAAISAARAAAASADSADADADEDDEGALDTDRQRAIAMLQLINVEQAHR